MSELNNKEYENYENSVDIKVRTEYSISGEDMKIIQEASNTIIDTAKKYFDYGTIATQSDSKDKQ